MSSDDKEKDANGQESDWNSSFDQDQLPDQDEMPPLNDAQDEEDIPPYAIYEDDEEPEEPDTSRSLLLGQFGQYLSLILTPLLLGGLTCLFVLPLVAARHAALPPQGVWPITLVIITLAVAQGVAIYYAGTDNGLWAISTVGGFFLFLLVGCFAIFGFTSGIALLILLIGLSILLAHFYIHLVPEGYVDVVYAFGKYHRTLYPGFNILLPWEKGTRRLNASETQWVCPEQRVQMSRDEDVVLRASLAYQLDAEDAQLAATKVKNWEDSLRTYFIASLRDIANTFTPEDFMVWPHGMHTRSVSTTGGAALAEGGVRRQQVNTLLFQRMQDRVAPWGVFIKWVLIQDIILAPHKTASTNAPAAPVQQTQHAQHTQAQANQPTVQATSTAKSSQPQAARGSEQSARTQAATMPPPAQENSSSSPNISKENILINLYKEVQAGKITDPRTIRDIAEKFQEVADDPSLSQVVSFDAARAALSLYTRANRREEEENASKGTLFNDDTKPDWNFRQPSDENLMGGG